MVEYLQWKNSGHCSVLYCAQSILLKVYYRTVWKVCSHVNFLKPIIGTDFLKWIWQHIHALSQYIFSIQHKNKPFRPVVLVHRWVYWLMVQALLSFSSNVQEFLYAKRIPQPWRQQRRPYLYGTPCQQSLSFFLSVAPFLASVMCWFSLF